MPSIIIKLVDIEPNPVQPRKEFDEQKLRELAENIKQVGLKQPLIVRPLPTMVGSDRGKYQLVDGERRYRACKLIPLEEVPVDVREDIKTEQDAALQSFIINEERANYSSQDRDAYIFNLYETTKLSIRKLADKIGKHHSFVDHCIEAHKFRQKLPPTMVGTLELSHAVLRDTAVIKDTELRIAFLRAIHDKKISRDSKLIGFTASILSRLPKEAWEVYFRRLMTIEELDLYLIRNKEYNEAHEARLQKSGIKEKHDKGEMSGEEYYNHPLNNQPTVLMPMLKASELVERDVKEHFLESADLIKEERTGIVYLSDPEKQKTFRFVFDVEKERRDPEYQRRIHEIHDKMIKKHDFGMFYLEALAEWGMACEDDTLQSTADIEDLDFRIKVLDLVIDHRFAKWIQKAWHPFGEYYDPITETMKEEQEELSPSSQ